MDETTNEAAVLPSPTDEGEAVLRDGSTVHLRSLSAESLPWAFGTNGPGPSPLVAGRRSADAEAQAEAPIRISEPVRTT